MPELHEAKDGTDRAEYENAEGAVVHWPKRHGHAASPYAEIRETNSLQPLIDASDEPED